MQLGVRLEAAERDTNSLELFYSVHLPTQLMAV